MSHQADRRRKYNTTNCLLSPSPSALHLHICVAPLPSIKICFPTSRFGYRTASHETPPLVVWQGARKERRPGDSRATLEVGGVGVGGSEGLGGVRPLTWGNICCVEMETDDSNYVQSQGLPGEDGGRNGGEFEATASIRTPPPSYSPPLRCWRAAVRQRRPFSRLLIQYN